jgi:tetratricopeptide (TPR) repeat protein/O-antigen ligase
MAAEWVVAHEPWFAVVSATVLLLAPNPLIWPAILLGAAPLVGRTVLTGRPWRATAFDLPLVLLAIGALVGGYASLSRDGALIRLTGLLAGLYLFVAVREHAGGEHRLRQAVLGALIVTVAVSALLLVLVGPFLRLDHVPALAGLVGAIDRWHLGDWWVDQDWLLQRYRFRASGVGTLADVGLALAFAALIGVRSGRARLAVGGCIAFFLIMLIVADNRGSMVAGALTLGVMATVWRRRLLPLIPLGVVAVVALVALSPSDRGLSLNTLAQRFWFWENSLYLAREVPLTGAGLGLESVQLVYRAYFQPSYPPFSHAHDIYLQGLLEYGVFGLAGLVGLGLATLWVGWRLPPSLDRWTMAGRLAGLGISLAMLTTGLTEIAMLTTLGGVVALLGLGLLAGGAGPGATALFRCSSPLPPTSSPDHGGPLPPTPSPVRGRGGERLLAPLTVVGAVAAVVVVLAGGLAVSGAGAPLAGRLLLNLGTAELNRGSLSESLARSERPAVLDRAVALLRLAANASPDDPAIQRNLALALAASDDARRARAAADRARALTSGDNREDLFQLGRAYAAVSAWGETTRAWQAAGAAPQLLQLGNRLLRARNFDQAENAYMAAARVDLDSRGAYDGIATAARQRGMSIAETVDEFAPLLEPGSPTEYDAHLGVARVYRDMGMLREAMVELRKAEAIRSGPDLSFEIGQVALRAGLADSAEAQFVRATTDQSADPDGWLGLAQARFRLGHYEDAVSTVRQALSRLDPSGRFAPPAERLPETAAVRAEQIKRSERAPLLGVMGESLLALDRPAEAIPALNEAVDALPNDPWLRATRAAAEAGVHGAPPNLIANPSFLTNDTWVLRDPDWTVRPTLDDLSNDLPVIADGQAHFSPTPPGLRVLVQEVGNLVPGARYRVTARVRGEGLGHGRIRLSLVSPQAPIDPLDWATTDSADWTTIQVEAVLKPPTSTGAYVVLNLTDASSFGAVAWCDEITMVRVDGPR